MEGLRRNANRKAKQASAAASSKMETSQASVLAMERRRRNPNRNGNQASASEAGDRDLKRKDSSVYVSVRGEILKRKSEGGEILKRKKEIFALIPPKHVLLGTELTEEEAKRLVAREKKRKMVVVKRVPQELIDYMMETPDPIMSTVIPDDELAKRSEHFREFYAKQKAMNDKVKAYHQAIVDQYIAHGYAEDESEITDNEEEMVKK